MGGSTKRDSIAFLSTFPPRQCGIATFTNSLLSACSGRIDRRLELFVIALDRPEEELGYAETVRHTIDQPNRLDYVEAAEFINYTNVKALSLQHEFGIYGGPDGEYVLDLLRDVRCPVITTLHTILDEPGPGQRKVMEELLLLSRRVVVMSQKGLQLLSEVYDASPDKLLFIPHGVDNLPLVEPDLYKEQFGWGGRRVLLTFGLLSAGKGIENMLRALPPIVQEHPDVCYVILGATHPEILKREGQKYRLELQRLARELGLERNVLFIDRFVKQRELGEFLKAADVYVTPYPNREQITSGTLAYALGAGKPIVSTNYWYAEELLDEGRGIVVDVQKPEALTGALLGLLDDPERLRGIRAKAYEHGRGMVWGEVGQRYVDTFRAAMSAERVRAVTPDVTMRRLLPITGLPRPKLDHLVSMTDDTGLLQHALYALPDRNHGYTVDDNARAILAAVRFNHLFHDKQACDLLSVYMGFIRYAQRQDGLFRNFMAYNRQFLDTVCSDDCFGRCLWGLGYAVYRGPDRFHAVAKQLMEQAMSGRPMLEVLNPRGRSNAILGLYNYLQRFPEAHDIEDKIDRMASKHIEMFRHHGDEGWVWFEPVITYENALLPHSLFLAYQATGRELYLDVAVATLDFLLERCFRDQHLSLVGNDGWFRKGSDSAQFDQQPVDAGALVEALKVAYSATGQRSYMKAMRSAFDWFLGVNDLEKNLYDFATGGCGDGLTAEGVNLNQGAESTLSCLLALLALFELYSEQGAGGCLT